MSEKKFLLQSKNYNNNDKTFIDSVTHDKISTIDKEKNKSRPINGLVADTDHTYIFLHHNIWVQFDNLPVLKSNELSFITIESAIMQGDQQLVASPVDIIKINNNTYIFGYNDNNTIKMVKVESTIQNGKFSLRTVDGSQRTLIITTENYVKDRLVFYYDNSDSTNNTTNFYSRYLNQTFAPDVQAYPVRGYGIRNVKIKYNRKFSLSVNPPIHSFEQKTLYDTSIKFNGTDNYIQSNSVLNWHQNTNDPINLELWIFNNNFNINEEQCFLSINDTTNNLLYFSIENKKLSVKQNNTKVVLDQTKNNIENNKWYHLFFSLNKTGTQLFINGINLINNNTKNFTKSLNNCTFTVGANLLNNQYKNFFEGYLDRISINSSLFDTFISSNKTNEWDFLKKVNIKNIKSFHNEVGKTITTDNTKKIDNLTDNDSNTLYESNNNNAINSGILLSTDNRYTNIKVISINTGNDIAKSVTQLDFFGVDSRQLLNYDNNNWKSIKTNVSFPLIDNTNSLYYTGFTDLNGNDKNYNNYKILIKNLKDTTEKNIQISDLTLYTKIVPHDYWYINDFEKLEKDFDDNYAIIDDNVNYVLTTPTLIKVRETNSLFKTIRNKYDVFIKNKSKIDIHTLVEINIVKEMYLKILKKFVDYFIFVLKKYYNQIIELENLVNRQIDDGVLLERITNTGSIINTVYLSKSNNYGTNLEEYKKLTDYILSYLESLKNQTQFIDNKYKINTLTGGIPDGINTIFSDLETKKGVIDQRILRKINEQESVTVTETDGYINTWDNSSDVKKGGSMVVSRFNFRNKNNFISSGDRTKRLANIEQMKSINTRKPNISNTNYKLKNGEIVKYKNHKTLLNIQKGFSSLYKNCRLENNICADLNDSNHTVEDYKDFKRLGGGGSTKNGYQTNFKIDKCNIANGLITTIPIFNNYKRFDLNLNLRKKVKQLNVNCQEPKEIFKNTKANIHEIDDTQDHHHYFPISQEETGNSFGYYVHQHEQHDHDKSTVPNYTFDHFVDRYARFPMNFFNN